VLLVSPGEDSSPLLRGMFVEHKHLRSCGDGWRRPRVLAMVKADCLLLNLRAQFTMRSLVQYNSKPGQL